MKKIVILDTNVLLDNPKSLFSFKNQLVVIPLSVIEELDTFKKGMNDLAKNSREVLRKLDKLRKENKAGMISQKGNNQQENDIGKMGIELKHGGRIIIELNHIDKVPSNLDATKVDNRIISVALFYKENFPDSVVELISQDANVRIKADALGIKTENHELTNLPTTHDGLYKGIKELSVSQKDLEKFDAEKSLLTKEKMLPNEFAILVNKENKNDNRLTKFCPKEKKLVVLSIEIASKDGIFGLSPRNTEQACALDLLLNPDIPLVTITGKAGTGKTLLAVAAGMHSVLEQQKQIRMLIARPVMPLGKDIGFLPGTVDEKMNPWMQPIFDNLEFLFGGTGKKAESRYQNLIDQGLLKVEPLTYIRGRSIPKQFMLIDEAQNLSIHEIKTIITRAGKDTKIILTGDPEQIDNPYLDSLSNGLSQVIELLKDQALTGHIHLVNGERSPLAEMASEVLK